MKPIKISFCSYILSLAFCSSTSLYASCEPKNLELESAYKKLEYARSKLTSALTDNPFPQGLLQEYEHDFKHAHLLKESCELVLEHTRITEQQNKERVFCADQMHEIIQKICVNLHQQKRLLECHPNKNSPSIQEKLRAITHLSNKYAHCLPVFIPVALHITQNKEDITEKKEKKTAANRKKKAKAALRKQALKLGVTQAKIFPILAIRCKLSHKTKNSHGDYIQPLKSSYQTLHIIAQYLALPRK